MSNKLILSYLHRFITCYRCTAYKTLRDNDKEVRKSEARSSKAPDCCPSASGTGPAQCPCSCDAFRGLCPLHTPHTSSSLWYNHLGLGSSVNRHWVRAARAPPKLWLASSDAVRVQMHGHVSHARQRFQSYCQSWPCTRRNEIFTKKFDFEDFIPVAWCEDQIYSRGSSS